MNQSLLGGGPGEFTFAVADSVLNEFKSKLPLKVTLNIGISVTYPNVIKKIVAQADSAVAGAKILTVDLKYPGPRISSFASATYPINEKKGRCGLTGTFQKFRVQLSVPAEDVPAIQSGMALDLHTDE